MEIGLIVILLSAVITLSAVMLYREFKNVKDHVERLEQRMRKLEQANRKRMPFDAVDKLLNARAALDRYKTENKFFNDLIENAESWLDSAMQEGTKRDEK